MVLKIATTAECGGPALVYGGHPEAELSCIRTEEMHEREILLRVRD
jgi:hypothetical protein